MSNLTADYLWRGARLIKGCLTGQISHANVQITNRCNMRCGFCTFPQQAIAPKDELTTAQWLTISKRLSNAGSVLVSIEGGEPTLRPDLPEIIAGFARWHHPFVYTNGWFITEELARSLWSAGLIQAGVSIDYAAPHRHDRSRGLDGAFEGAVRAVEILRDTAPRGGPQVHVLSILLDDNLDQLDELLEVSGKLGVRHMLTYLSTFGHYRGKDAQQPPRESIAPRIFALKKRHPHLAIFRSYIEGVDRYIEGAPPPCKAGLHSMNIDHLGNVAPCIELAHDAAANLVTDDWGTVRRKLAAKEEPRTCTACWTLCRGTTEAMAGAPVPSDWRDFFSELV